MKSYNYNIIIIGGGVTGVAIAHDMMLRGFNVTLIEQGELFSGTTRYHHGVLHSGARYAVSDPVVAKECIEENKIIQKITSNSLHYNYALYVASNIKEYEYSVEFMEYCKICNIPTRDIDLDEAFHIEPFLSREIKRVIEVPDVIMDPYYLPKRFINTAIHNGAHVITNSSVQEIFFSKNTIYKIGFRDLHTKEYHELKADIIINAAGPWVGEICKLVNIDIPISNIAGLLFSVSPKLSHRIISRLYYPGDGDSIVPRGDYTILGSNSWVSNEPRPKHIPDGSIEYIRQKTSELIPMCAEAKIYEFWSASRPLYGQPEDTTGREISRTFNIIDHSNHNRQGLITVVGGKATTARRVAEVTTDIACRVLKITIPCQTKEELLLPIDPFSK